MNKPKETLDFTVDVSIKEKVLTVLLFAFGMGAVIYLARHYAAVEGRPPHLYFNLSFAVAVFGVIRMARAIAQQTRRGLLATTDGLQIATLFSQSEMPYEELRSTPFLFKDKPAPEVSFRWGQFKYRLPVKNIEKLAALLAAKDIPVGFADGPQIPLPSTPTKEASPRYRPQRPPVQVLMALIFWSLGTVAMFYTARL